jgi:hypothetical protein
MVRASGIPELRRFCHTITAASQLLEAKNFLQSTLSSLLNSVELYASTPPVPQPDDEVPEVPIDDVLDETRTEVGINLCSCCKRLIFGGARSDHEV